MRRNLLLEAALLGCLVLLITTWFGAGPGGLPPAVPLAALLLLGALRWRRNGAPAWRRPAPETLAALGAAVLYRLPALVHPWGWVNRDGAYPAFVALHLIEGIRPAPIFTEGAHYQGTLKGHLGALLGLLTGVRDLSLLMVLSSLLLYLVCVAATMAVVRRVAGRPAALVAGLYLAISPRFLTVFSLNCVGQYVDVLALGGLALALVARFLSDDRRGPEARGRYLAIGLLLGAAFWQQPVALAYVAAAGLALALRRATWRDAWSLLVPAGILVGALPVLLWNVQNHWQTGDIMGREPGELAAQADALLHLIRRTLSISFATLSGLSPGHPWGHLRPVAAVGYALVPGALVFYLLLRGREIVASIRAGRPSPALLPPLLLACCLAQWWAVAAGRIYWRPRYLLPVTAVTAMHVGVVVAWLWARARTRAVAAALFGALLAVNVGGTWPRLRSGAEVAAPYERLVRALEDRGIRTGYADFSISAPVTMFTGERIVFSSRLGPTASYESERHTQKVAREGPDAYVLRADDDPERFAAALRSLGVSYKLDIDPYPIFYGFSRRVRLDEVAGFRGEEEPEPSPGES